MFRKVWVSGFWTPCRQLTSRWLPESLRRNVLLILLSLGAVFGSATTAYSQAKWEYQRLSGPPVTCRVSVGFSDAGGGVFGVVFLVDANGIGGGGYVLLLRGHSQLPGHQGSGPLAVKVEVDTFGPDYLNMTPSVTPDGNTLLTGHGSDLGFLEEIKHGQRLTISVDGMPSIEATLAGSAIALQRLDDCANSAPIAPSATSSATLDDEKPAAWAFTTTNIDGATICSLGTSLVGPHPALLTLIHRSSDANDLFRLGLTLLGPDAAIVQGRTALRASMQNDYVRSQVLDFVRIAEPNQKQLLVFAASLRQPALADNLTLEGKLTLDVGVIGKFVTAPDPNSKAPADWAACIRGDSPPAPTAPPEAAGGETSAVSFPTALFGTWEEEKADCGLPVGRYGEPGDGATMSADGVTLQFDMAGTNPTVEFVPHDGEGESCLINSVSGTPTNPVLSTQCTVEENPPTNEQMTVEMRGEPGSFRVEVAVGAFRGTYWKCGE